MSVDAPIAPRPPWRPTDYRPEYCEAVIEYGRNGKSRAWIAAELGVCKQTLRNWEAVHPDFLAAMTRAKLLEQRWWEEAGQVGLTMPGFCQSMWSRSMGARFPDDWREAKDVNNKLDASDNLAKLLTKVLTENVFPGDDERGA